MGPSIPRGMNRDNLLQVTDALTNIEHLVFFGALLGLARDGDLIEGDDDIDLYVSLSDRENVIERMLSVGFKVDLLASINQSPYFLQAFKYNGDVKTLVDFYFYEDHRNTKFIRDQWNFVGTPEVESTHMIVPKKMLFPIKKQVFFNKEISMPADPEKVCQYLYGKTWMVRLEKRKGYRIAMVSNRPRVFVGTRGKVLFMVVRLFQKLSESLS